MSLNESTVEDAALEWFGELGYSVGHGPHLAPGEPTTERGGFGDVVLVGLLRETIQRLNPTIPEETREDVLRKVLRAGTPALTQTNRAFHQMLRDGVPCEYSRADGSIAGDHVRLLDFADAQANDWLAVNYCTALAEAARIRVEANRTQPRALATLRDTLLPKLLSGELSMAALESKLEAVR